MLYRGLTTAVHGMKNGTESEWRRKEMEEKTSQRTRNSSKRSAYTPTGNLRVALCSDLKLILNAPLLQWGVVNARRTGGHGVREERLGVFFRRLKGSGKNTGMGRGWLIGGACMLNPSLSRRNVSGDDASSPIAQIDDYLFFYS